jgi:hypothetical protein
VKRAQGLAPRAHRGPEQEARGGWAGYPARARIAVRLLQALEIELPRELAAGSHASVGCRFETPRRRRATCT